MTTATRTTVRRLLVPLDGSASSERAVEPAAAFAARAEIPIQLLSIDSPLSARPSHAQAVRLARELPTSAPVEVVSVDDEAADAVAQQAEKVPGTLVIASERGPHRTSGVFTSSLAAGLLARGLDVVVVGPHARTAAPDLPVVVCVDETDESEQVFPAAAAVAASLGVPLVVITVVTPELESPAGTPSGRPPADEIVSAAVARARSVAPDLDVTGRVVTYPWGIAHAIALHVERHPAQLVAVAAHVRRGWAKLVSPSVASRLVRELQSPVLLVPIDPEAQIESPAVAAPAPARRKGAGAERPAPFDHVVVPIDPTLGHVEPCESVAREIAGAADASVELVTGEVTDVESATIAAALADRTMLCLPVTRSLRDLDPASSVAGRLVRWSPAPVVLVGARCERPVFPVSGVVACVDGSLVSDAVADLAAQWAAWLQVPLRVLTVTDSAAEVRGATSVADAYVARLATETSSRYGIHAIGERVAGTTPARAIAAWHESHPGWIDVLGTHGHGASRQSLGRVVRAVARSSRTPVVLATRSVTAE